MANKHRTSALLTVLGTAVFATLPAIGHAQLQQQTPSAQEQAAQYQVDILWEGHTYTPPFYKGRPLPSAEAPLRISAYVSDPSGTVRPADETVFRWMQDGVILGSFNGRGNDSISLTSALTENGETRISLATERNGTGTSTDAAIAAQPIQPTFYQKHPLRGVAYHDALGDTYTPQRDEFTMRIAPYFVSINDIVNGEIEYRWKQNGTDMENVSNNTRELTLRQPSAGQQGAAAISVEVRNYEHVLQSAMKEISVQLNQ